MFAIITYLVIGGVIGFMVGLNYKSAPTPILNFKRLENENNELEAKVDRYKQVIQDLIEDNKRLVKELDKK